jgi:outer membrane protein
MTGEIMSNRYQALIGSLVILCAAALSPALAQTPVPPATPPTQITPRPVPGRTVGLDPDKTINWTLRDAILNALEKNVDIEIDRASIRLAQFDLAAAQGVYDPVGASTFAYNSFTQPNTRLFSGTNAATTSQNSLTYNFGVQQFIERTGGSYAVSFNNNRVTNNFGTLSPQYNPQLVLSVSQPLLRNFKTDTFRRLIKISKKRLDLSDAQFRQRAIEIIARTQQAYWDLAFAIKDEQIQRDAVRLAETQLNNNQRQVEVGTLAPIDVVSAATELETRRQQVFQAMNAVAQAENALKALTVGGVSDELWAAKIVPVENFEATPISMPLNDAMRLARENRPELKQFALQKELNQVDIDFFRNQAKPQLDLVGSYSMIGVGGVRNPNNPLALSTPACVPGQPAPPAGCLPGNLIGGYRTSLANLFRNDFRTWSVGVNIGLPWRNRVAKANLGRAIEAEKQIDLQTRRQLQSIEVEVRNAVQSVEIAKLRIDASRAARQYAEQQLEGEEKRFQAGLSTTFLVLTRQTQLSQARGAELRALTDYNKAVAELQRVLSTTLTSNSVEVKGEPLTDEKK